MSDAYAQGRLYKDWLASTGKASNTANNYLTGINTLSKHLGKDVLLITNPQELDELCRQCGQRLRGQS